ncbi:hypothetical protein RN001_006607 [Aquatica leii]|uniref:Uncharacterized protein n=1 Tax=Aquatica leii TaxID=1421715 RepID=A0AAN7SQA0_9COLE|nr:hypothetical protein RN001_006607 [Aquatica leii]
MINETLISSGSRLATKTLTSFFSKENKEYEPTNELSTCTSRETNTLSKPSQIQVIVQHTESESRKTPVCLSNKLSTVDNSQQDPSPTSQDLTTAAKPRPFIWSQDIWERKQSAFPWPDSSNGILGCKVCRDIGSEVERRENNPCIAARYKPIDSVGPIQSNDIEPTC